MKLWIDDVRPTPPGYFWCKSVNEAKRVIIEYSDKLGFDMNAIERFDERIDEIDVY